MIDPSKEYPPLRRRSEAATRDTSMTDVTPLRAAIAQLLCATGAAAALAGVELTADRDGEPDSMPRPLAWAPLVVGPIAAAAQLQYTRESHVAPANAVRVLDGAVIALGGALFIADLVTSRKMGARGVGALAFASVGLLGYLLERHEEQAASAERKLRRRADVVERLVPRRRPKLDRVVVHV